MWMRIFGAGFLLLGLCMPTRLSAAEMLSLTGLRDLVDMTFSMSYRKEKTVLWVSLENARSFVAVFSHTKSFRIDSSRDGTYKVSKLRSWESAVADSVSRGAMPRARFEEMDSDEKSLLESLFMNAAASNTSLDSIDGPVSAETQFELSIVGGDNSAVYLHSQYASGVSLGLILLMMTKPWSTGPMGFLGLITATTGLPVLLFFVIAIRFPNLFSDDRWNPMGRYSPAIIGFGVTVAPTLCHFALRLIP